MTNQIGFDGGLTCAMQCTDLARSVSWYEDTLGFSLLYKVDEMGWCELKSPVDKVALGLSEVENPEVKGGATLTFGVSDIDSARAALEAKNIAFDGETLTIPKMVKLATFYDPDGNKLMFYQELSAQS